MNKEFQQLKTNIYITVIFTAVLWVAWLSDMLFDLNLPQYGIVPRTLVGLRGILLSPFIHDNRNISHILSNTFPFMVLFFVLLATYSDIAIVVLVLIHVLTGLSVWLLAPANTVHVGISGVIYGIAAFLVGSGIFRMNLMSIAISILVIFLYGGMVAGFVPQPGISWQSHVCGAVVGFFLAFNFRHFNRAPKPVVVEAPEDDRHFFERHP